MFLPIAAQIARPWIVRDIEQQGKVLPCVYLAHDLVLRGVREDRPEVESDFAVGAVEAGDVDGGGGFAHMASMVTAAVYSRTSEEGARTA